MSKYITRDQLADFVERMWAAGLRVESNPERGYLSVVDANYHTEYVNVVNEGHYEEMVAEFVAAAEAAKAAKDSSDEL